jgi:hypothetical protein
MSLVEWSGVLSNFAQVVGAIGVVVTLVYLSVQVKQNTEAIQCTNATTVQINFQNLARDLSTDRELADVIIRAIKGNEDLTHAEKLAAYGWFFGLLKAGERGLDADSVAVSMRTTGMVRWPSTARTGRRLGLASTGLIADKPSRRIFARPSTLG